MKNILVDEFAFGENQKNNRQSPSGMLENEKKDVSQNDLQEALKILGLDRAPLLHSEDYDWMIEITKRISQERGIEYFRKDVMNLMDAWDAFAKRREM